MPYIYSTLTCDNFYPVFADKSNPQALSVIKKKILVKGGHGVATYRGIQTPQGIVTVVSEEDLAILEAHPAFKKHRAAGFVTVDKKDVKPEIMAKNMEPKDGSAQITPDDFEQTEYEKGVTTLKSKKSRTL
jgi:hypothetical protein